MEKPLFVARPLPGKVEGAGGLNDKTAGANSPHLDEREQTQAAAHAAPQALVIHEVVREEGELELRRRNVALLWSGLAAGLSMGFSLLTLALLRAGLPETPWRALLDSPGYCVGFMIAIRGRQQLFTESTLTALLPLMVRRDLPQSREITRSANAVIHRTIGFSRFGTVSLADRLASCSAVPFRFCICTRFATWIIQDRGESL